MILDTNFLKTDFPTVIFFSLAFTIRFSFQNKVVFLMLRGTSVVCTFTNTNVYLCYANFVRYLFLYTPNTRKCGGMRMLGDILLSYPVHV